MSSHWNVDENNDLSHAPDWLVDALMSQTDSDLIDDEPLLADLPLGFV